MKVTDAMFDQAITDYGFDTAAAAREEAISAYRCNALAGASMTTCEEEELEAFRVFLAASEKINESA